MNKLIFTLIIVSVTTIVYADSLKVPILETDSTILGAGYNVETEAITDRACVTGKLVKENRPSSLFILKFESDRRQIENKLSLVAGARIVSGAAKTTIGANYLKHTIEDSHSIVLNYVSEYQFYSLTLSGDPSAEAKDLDDQNEKFKDACGTHYIRSQIYGAQLFITIKLVFASIKEKQAMEAQLRWDDNISLMFANLKKNQENFTQRAKVLVTAYQIGGDVSKLTMLFAGNDVQGSKPIVQCSMGDFSKCEDVVTRAINYSMNTRTGFPSQFEEDSNTAVIYTFASPYSSVFLFPEVSQSVEETVKATRISLNKTYMEVLKQYLFIEGLLSGVVRLTSAQTADLEQKLILTCEKLNKVTNTIELCFQNSNKCIALKLALDADEGQKLFPEDELKVKKRV